ncbi:thiol:disulfide interchange protein DsbD [Prevotella aff. ruminicola Tc2-24]|uniref:Thiol:disulfide interchange protein DsbD n=1 Tax=Prevotella aff. ruminicola Tc2-24 TaxID=81582 RepID=A0A1I0MPA5_9BACT|nr:cytochrome c biogenesis protein CcdA [Prevotella aff. ruminicola Tc2-24]SEV90356.1 thiol:disulfide interchange protein DsbD [Prevotella aff. ruminicola Tc2-24]
MRKLLSILFMMLMVLAMQAQMLTPIHFTTQLKELKGGEAELIFSATIDQGWHVYSTDLGDGGPVSAAFHIVKMDGAQTVGKLQARGHEIKQYDKLFDMDLRYFEKAVTFVQRIRFTKSEYDINCYVEYGACNDEVCLPPSEIALKQKGKTTEPIGQPSSSDKEQQESLLPQKDESQPTQIATTDTLVIDQSLSANGQSLLWEPVIKELQAYNGETDSDKALSWWMIFLEGLLGGFIALFTPCVWPIIPMTVSFFLKRNKDQAKAIREAASYGLSIVVIYVLLGLAVTLLFGASALNALATNAIVNIFFCLLLVLFAASFFGAFELTLPSSWSNKIDAKSEKTTGMLSIFLMAFTLALVSFSCTGPIIGFLLVAVSTQGSIVAPTIGMLGFAIALAIPFTLFAMFPSLLKAAPKSGDWMNVIKVTLGFIELAFALKFLSVADLAYGWHILDREAFLSIWIVIFGLLGAYLLGWLKFSHDNESHRTNVPRFFLAMASLAFTVYMIPGLWGAPLKGISAFTPPMNTQDFNLQKSVTEARFTDYESGMAAAKAEHKPVIIDFTGFGCVNCRKMEAAVWTDTQVADILNKDYVLISLYVDDKTTLSEPIKVTENGQDRTLRTVGEKWSYLQRVKFGANAQPFYVLLDNEGRPLNGSRSYDEDIQAYITFLNQGLTNYRK